VTVTFKEHQHTKSINFIHSTFHTSIPAYSLRIDEAVNKGF